MDLYFSNSDFHVVCTIPITMAAPNSRRNFSKPQKDIDDNAESPFDSPFGPAAADNATPTRQRLSLSGRLPKPSRDSPWRRIVDEELGSPAALERPPIPSALAPTDETLSSPLPVLPMIVLSIVGSITFVCCRLIY